MHHIRDGRLQDIATKWNIVGAVRNSELLGSDHQCGCATHFDRTVSDLQHPERRVDPAVSDCAGKDSRITQEFGNELGRGTLV